MARFKAGDLVRLKSGGPTMTTSDLLPGGYYSCTRVVHGHILKTGNFKEHELNLASAGVPSSGKSKP
jgi:uncharacterized protein YodC (DUF2158 family)